MNFFKNNWFGIFIGLIVFWFMLFFALVAFAPHQDVAERGFVKCTNQMADRVQNCLEDKFFCTLGAITQNASCDFEVIADGLSLWLKGEQDRPWSNYYYTPILEEDSSDDELEGQEEYLKENPSLSDSLNKLKIENKELEENDDEQ